MQKVTIFIFTLTLFFPIIPASYAYETIPFRNGGSIEGIVEFVGTAPADPMLTLTSETKYCGDTLPAKKYLIKDRQIENVIVSITGIKVGKPFHGGAVTVTSQNCEFIPHVAIGFKGNKITMKTEDSVFHTFDVHISTGGKELYHVALPEKGSSVTKSLTKAGLLELSCYVHPWQHAYVYVFDHPYAAVTDEKGRFTISNIPPGTYAIEAWHEALGIKKISNIKIESGKTNSIKLEYSEK
jgi:hypothetical protein